MKDNDNEKKNIVIAQKKANISVPITVTPRVDKLDAISYCCGDPVIIQRSCQCERCRKLGCSFVLSQNICIEIPIEFSADAVITDACIDCNLYD